MDSGRSRRPHHLRRDLGCLRAGPRFRQARCGDLLLAEGAGRRGRAWRHHPVAPRGGAARELYAALAAAQDLPHDQRRQADLRHLRGRDHQHALHALRRGLHRGAELGQGHRRSSGAHGKGRCQCRRGAALDRPARLRAEPCARRGDPLQYLGLPHAGSGRGCAQEDGQAARDRRCGLSTSAPIATRRRAFASGAAPRSRHPTSQR